MPAVLCGLPAQTAGSLWRFGTAFEPDHSLAGSKSEGDCAVISQPQQPVIRDKNGALRYHPNRIVQYITEHGGFDPGHLTLLDFSLEDQIQYNQLLGKPVNEER